MAQSSGSLHESTDQLPPEVIERHRAIVSLMEELEAVDWYDQRVAACHDPELRRVLSHNRDEEKEHAAMMLEWLRRNDPVFDRHLRKFLFSEGPIKIDVSDAASAPEKQQSAPEDSSLRVGSLRAQVTP